MTRGVNILTGCATKTAKFAFERLFCWRRLAGNGISYVDGMIEDLKECSRCNAS